MLPPRFDELHAPDYHPETADPVGTEGLPQTIDRERAAALAEALRPALFSITRYIRQEHPDAPVNSFEISLLHAIEREPGVGISVLAQRHGMRAALISATIKLMSEQGWLTTRTDVYRDRRRVGLFLTADGLEITAAVRERRTRRMTRELVLLNEEELRALEASIEPLRKLGSLLRTTTQRDWAFMRLYEGPLREAEAPLEEG